MIPTAITLDTLPVVGVYFILAALLIFLPGLAVHLGRKRPVRVSHSELNHRLDAEGLAKYSRPATSNRKSGRVSS